MPDFADNIFDRYPLPAPPQAHVSDLASAFFGVNPDTTGAYAKGLTAGSEYRLRSAQAEQALAEADKRRADALAPLRQQKIYDARMGGDPNAPLTISDALGIATGAHDATEGALGVQQFGNRATLVDPNATPQAQFLAGQGVQGKPLPHLYDVGGETVNQFTAPDTTFRTPAQNVVMGANKALEGERNRAPAGGHAGAGPLNSAGEKAPTGYRWDATDDSKLVPIEGGAKDPNNPAPMSAREGIFTSRVLGGASQAVRAIKNIVQLPIGASSGVLGLGAAPGESIMAAGRDALRNTLSDQDTQSYNRMMVGLTRNLAVIETQGLAPPGSFSQSFGNLSLRAGDTQLSKLQALAEMRQTIEAGLEPMLANPRVPKETIAKANELLHNVQDAVPFTWQDLIDLEAAQRKNPATTLMDVARSNGLGGHNAAASGGPAAAAAPAAQTPAAAIPSPKTQADYNAIPSGTVYIDTDGQRKRKR